MSTGRNDPCPCGSGRKYKQCCLGQAQVAGRVEQRFGVAAAAPGAADDVPAGTWQVDLAPLDLLADEDAAAGPAVALVVGGGRVLAADLRPEPSSPGDDLAAELAGVIRQAAGAVGRWPARVEVRDAEVAARLGELLAPRPVQVTHRADLAALDAAAESMRESVLGSVDDMPESWSPETWRGWGLPVETVAELFRAAAGFWRRRPWDRVVSDDPFLAVEGTSHPWTCTVLGGGGEEFGLALYGDAADFLQMFDDGAPFTRLAGPILSLTFVPAADLEPRMRREVTSAGWEVAGPDAYPVLVSMNVPEGPLATDTAEDLRRLLLAIPEFVREHRGVLDPERPPAEPLEWRSPATGVLLRFEAGPLSDTLDLPWAPVERLVPSLPEGPGAEPEAALAFTDDSTGGAAQLAEGELAVVERFAEALRASGVSEATARRHADNAATFVEVLAGFAAVPVRAVTEYDLRTFLFDLYPRKVQDAASRVAAMPASLSRFFDFLEAHEGIRCPWAGAVLVERDAYRERFETFPGGSWWDEGVAEWRAVLAADLIERVLVHGATLADGSAWSDPMGPREAMLEHEVQRRWLLWRDEAIRGGVVDPVEVRRAAVERQHRWEREPHPGLGGRTPLQAIHAERAERGAVELPSQSG